MRWALPISSLTPSPTMWMPTTVPALEKVERGEGECVERGPGWAVAQILGQSVAQGRPSQAGVGGIVPTEQFAELPPNRPERAGDAGESVPSRWHDARRRRLARTHRRPAGAGL